MSSLRTRIRHPLTWLAVFGLLVLLGFLDSFREPSRQVTGSLYIAAVDVYQSVRGEWLQKYVRCRFRLSCSEYSKRAVAAYGIRYGLVLTVKRLYRCTT